MEPLVSVIVPIYNSERSIRRCLDSILSQNDCDFELILVDDGSIDSSFTICDHYASEYSSVRVIHQDNAGVASARNTGIEKANGKWLTFVDSDDWVEDGFLSSPIGVTSDLIISSWWTSVEEGVKAEAKYEKYDSGDVDPLDVQSYIEKHMNSTMFRTPWGKFYQRDIVDQYNIRFDSEFRLGEDTLFLLKYLRYVKTLYKTCTGCYVYTTCDFFSKYKLSVEESGLYLDAFSKYYMDQPYRSDSFVFETIYVYNNVSTNRTHIESILLKIRPSILELEWQYVCHGPLSARIKWVFMKLQSLLLYKVLKRIAASN